MLCLVKCDEGLFSRSVCKLAEAVQVRVCYYNYWRRLFGFTYVQVRFVLADAVF